MPSGRPQVRATGRGPRRRVFVVTVALCGALTGSALSGCGSISEKFAQTLAGAPAIGLPADVPERPATPPAYPAVHDMPPARPAVLTGAEQIRMEDELVTARTHQQALVGQPPPPAAAKPAAAAAKAASKKTASKKKAPAASPKSSTSSIY